jgi:hypothetical protein
MEFHQAGVVKRKLEENVRDALQRCISSVVRMKMVVQSTGTDGWRRLFTKHIGHGCTVIWQTDA